MKGTRTHFNQRSLAFIVLITGILGGLLIVFSILLLCKYCLNRKNLRETEQMKLLYETLNQVSLVDSNRLYHHGIREFSPLEPRRSNPLDRYQIPEEQRQVPNSKQGVPDYYSSGGQTSPKHTQVYHEIREQIGNQQIDCQQYGNINVDEEQAYLQVDPRCYVRQNSNASLMTHRKSDTPRLEKGHSLNVDTRSSPSSTSLSPYRQSSFDVTLTSGSQPQASTPSPTTSTQQDIFYTPRGSSISVVGNQLSNTLTTSQHLSPPAPSTSRKDSATSVHEKKNLIATIDPLDQTSKVRLSVSQRDHGISRSLEQSSSPVQELSSSNYATNDKQSRSFDAVHLLRPVTNRPDVVNRRTKSYEYADDHQSLVSSIAPPPIVIKIPDMTELVQAAKLSQLKNLRDNTEIEEYQKSPSRKATLVQQISINDHDGATTASHDIWRLRQSYELEEQQRLDQTSPDDLSPDLLTSTSIDSAGAMHIHTPNANCTSNGGVAAGGGDDDPSKYQYRRKSSSNLLLPPPEVRRQALRRTFEKRRSCINQSNIRREQQLLKNENDLDEETNQDSMIDFSSLLNNFNSKSENSSFERSLETDFDMQSDTSSRGHNDQFTSIESSGNENAVPDSNCRRQQQSQPSPHQDDSGYKSLESQNSQNRTFSLDWMSVDGAESVIYVGDGRMQQRSVDIKDLEDDLAQQQQQETNRNRAKLLNKNTRHSYQEASTNLAPPTLSSSNMMQQRSLSTNIPLVENYAPNSINTSIFLTADPSNSNENNNYHPHIVPSQSFCRSASKKRREFGKDKRNASSTVTISPTAIDDHQIMVYETNETNTKPSSPSSSSSLQVRNNDLRRTKSDETRNSILQSQDDESSTKPIKLHSNETKSDTQIPMSSDGTVTSTVNANHMRQHLSPNTTNTINTRHILQRSPSSTTPSTTSSPQVVAFRSQRGSVSFDTQTPLINIQTATTNKNKPSTTYSILPTCITKPRLKFSMVRDTAMASLGHNAPVYSMPITRDYSIDEKTNRIVNEFLMHDPSLDGKSKVNDDASYRGTPKRHHHHRIRQKTLEEPISTNNAQKQSQQPSAIQQHQQSRSPVTKLRHHSSQVNSRKYSHYQYPSKHLNDNHQKKEDEDEDEEDNSSLLVSPLLKVNQSTTAVARRENIMTVESPSIIITGDDSGSQ